MMEKIRTAANSVIVKIIFGIIILAFIFTGVGGFLGFNSSSADDERLYIAKVDGEGISRAGFEEQVNQALAQSVSLGSDDAIQPIIRRQVFLSNVDNHLNYKLAENLNLDISDEQVKNIIRQQSVFFVNGVFNNERYLTLLQQNGYTPDLYAELLRADAQKKQLLTGLLLTNFSLPIESELSQLLDQKREGYYTRVNVNDVIDKSVLEASEDEIQQYYQENQKKFMRSDRVKIKFLMNSYGDAMKQAKMPTEKEIKAEYDVNKAEYTQPGKYKFFLVQTVSEDEANQLNTRISKEKGISGIDKDSLINLGWFVESAIPDYLKSDLIKKGQSKVINMDGNYYVAFLDDIQKQQVLPFEYVSTKIKSDLFSQRTQDIYDLKNKKLLEAKEKYKTLEEMSTATELELFAPIDWQVKNDAFSIVSNKELENYIFSDEMIQNNIATENISDVIEITDPKSTYIIQVLDYKPEGLAPYDEVHTQVKDIIVAEKSKEMFEESVNKIVAGLNEGASDSRIRFTTKYDIQRYSTELGQSAADMIFSIIPPVQNKRTYGVDFDKLDSAIVAVVTKVSDGENRNISNDLINLNNNMSFLSFNAYLRSKAKIEMMPDANL